MLSAESLYQCVVLMNGLTCLTLETLPAGGTVAGVWSQTLTTIFTLLQANGCRENRATSERLII